MTLKSFHVFCEAHIPIRSCRNELDHNANLVVDARNDLHELFIISFHIAKNVNELRNKEEERF